MSGIPVSRRTLLRGAGLVAAGGLGVTYLSRTTARAVLTPGAARTLSVDPSGALSGRSDEVDLLATDDPVGTRDGVVRVTSSGDPTADYAFSVVKVRERPVRLSEVRTLTYDFLVGPDNAVGDRTAQGPDEVWLILKDGGDRREVFRTLNEPVTPNEWHTRAVHEEFDGLQRSPWKELSTRNRNFVPLGSDLLEAVGDARLLGVGFGRGDPVMGPSRIDAYYDRLVLNGTVHEFPSP